PVTVNAAPILDGDGLLGAVLVLREVAAQRQSERAMREAYTELDQRVVRRTAALERASAALRERNALLNAITTSTPDLIFAKDRQGRLLMANPAWSKAVGKSAEEAGSLDDNERLVLEAGETMIVEELLNTPGGERTYLTTKSPLRDEQGRVIGLIGVATDITERKHAQRELEKLVVAEQRLRAEAERANRAKDEFLAIVSNELSNAVKFTPEQGTVSVILHKSGERVQLQVKDNGIGIAPEFLPHVFDRFTQADTSAARRAGGLGIGLALVRHIALLHGGQ